MYTTNYVPGELYKRWMFYVHEYI